MHNNYYFFRLLAPEIAQRLQGARLLSCYSQSKNELTLHWFNPTEEEDFYFKVLLNADFSCISFPKQQFRAKRNSVDLFQEAVGLSFQACHLFENERYLLLSLDQQIGILLKMHGNRANVVLFKEDAPIALFKSKLKADRLLRLSALANPVKRTFEEFQQAYPNYRRLFPGFSKPVATTLLAQGFENQSSEAQWQQLQAMHRQLLAAEEIFVTEQRGSIPPFLSLLQPAIPANNYHSPILALNEFYYRYTREYSLNKEKEAAKKRLLRALRSGQNYLDKLKKREGSLEKGSRNRELADILMANLHLLKEGQRQAELFDFYRNETVRIKIKEGLSPQKNAEVYYRKAKNQEVEESYLAENIKAKQQRQQALEAQLEQLETLTDLKEVRKIVRQLPVNEADSEQADLLPYHEFIFAGFQILLGKSAEKNDALLRYHTHKDDLWLHAKDVAGSHVIIRKQGKQHIPPAVKEKAAALAAWHSKRRNDTLCPVSCTPRKYVRKPKGATPGLVIIEKEEQVLLVPPAPFADTNLRP